MARADVDLDDPAKSGGSAALNSADDLLAQLAGDEVDRMLSEADAAAPEALNVDRARPESAIGAVSHSTISKPEAIDRAGDGGLAVGGAAAGNDVFQATEAALDGLFDELGEAKGMPAAENGESKPASTASGAVAPVPASEEQSIEDVISQRAQSLIAQARIEADADSAALAEAPALSETGVPLSAAQALAAEMEADEREHLEALRRMKAGGNADEAPAPANFAPPPKAAAPPEPIAEVAPAQIDEATVDFAPPEKIDRVPMLVRVLEWINAPLAGFSDNVRSAIGKVAIITTFNAIGVFVYVMLFRRR
jgi:hypothetical protein